MKKFTVLASTLSLTLLALALAGCDAKNVATTDPTKTTPKTEAELLAMGEKLVVRGECSTCHSPIRMVDGAMQPDFKNAYFGGGNAWFTPGAGIGVSPNLTPGGTYMKGASVESLVEKWSDKTKMYLPPMPPLGVAYSEEELTAIATFLLKSDKVTPITEEPPASYYFATKPDNDATWPVPGSAATRLGADPSRIVPGGYEISVSPLTDDQLSQTMIEANIAAAKAGAAGH